MRLAAFAIILLALFNLNSAITLTGSPLTVNSLAQGLWCTLSYCDTTEKAQVAPPVKQATITITEKAYSPNELTVKAGEEIKLHLQNNDGSNCIQAFTIPQLGIQKVVPLGQSGDVTFTAPNKPGELKFMCSMGMYAGTIHVI
jgi:plastocyanin domain-containing protein